MPVATKITPGGKKTRSMSAVDRIADMDVSDEGLKMLVYGISGSGKTTFWSSFPGKTLAIICSGGAKPGELKSIDTPENRKRIKTVTLNESKEVAELAEHVAESGVYENVILDHLSGLQDLTLKEITGVDEIPAQKGWGFASQQQYGTSTAECKELLRRLLNLDCNVIIVAQERIFNASEETTSEMIAPNVGAGVTPSLAGWVNPAVDYIVQTFKRPRMEKQKTVVGKVTKEILVRGKGVEYCLRVGPHDLYMTKFRLPKGIPLPDVIVDPDYKKVIGFIKTSGITPKG